MIIPIGHENTTVRRLPWVTFSIMILCTLAWVAMVVGGGDPERQAAEEANQLFEYFMQRPYLELDPRLQELFFEGTSEHEAEALSEVFKEFGNEPPESEFLISQEQSVLDQMTEEFFDSLRSTPYHKWGLIPGAKTVHGFITYQFMHGGFWHLFWNMLFLYLAGPFIEDVWGRPIYAAFYLVSGVVSAAMYFLHYPDSQVPLIGASGAVAGVMGAFLVRYFNTKIRFFYWFFLVFRGTFNAPAWLMLPLWLLREFFFAQAMDVVGGGGVAHWAHVWGFAFGAAVALGMRHYKVESRFIDSAIESKVTLFDNAVLEEAMETYRNGNPDEAITILQKELTQNPDNLDAATSLWHIAVDHQRANDAAPYLTGAIETAIRGNEIDLIDPLFVDLVRAVPEYELDPVAAYKLSAYLRNEDRREEAFEILEAAEKSVSERTPVGVLVRLARFAGDISAPVTGTFVHLAMGCRDLPDEARESLEPLAREYSAQSKAELQKSFSKPEPEAAPSAPPSAPPDGLDELVLDQGGPLDLGGSSSEIKIMRAIPVGVDDHVMDMKVPNGARKLDLRSIKFVSLAGIAPEGERSYIVLDLSLDPLGAEKVRLVRMLSTQFDPRRVVGGDRPIDALRKLIGYCLDASHAEGIPSEAEVRAGKFPRFRSIEEYEGSLQQ